VEKHSVVIIEDHLVYVEGLKAILQKDPRLQFVGFARTAEEGLHLVRRAKPHLATIDLSLPDRSGIDLTREIRNESPVTKTVILTAHLLYEIVAESFRAGAAAFVVKDSPPDTILQSFQAVLRDEYFMDNFTAALLAKRFRSGTNKLVSDQSGTLTHRENEIHDYLTQGLSVVTIAQNLGLSIKSVANARSSIRKKLQDSTSSVTDSIVSRILNNK